MSPRPEGARWPARLTRPASSTAGTPPGALSVSGSSGEAVGAAANAKRVALSELTEVSRSLEDVFLELTGEEEGRRRE